jgi:hypothetical protein
MSRNIFDPNHGEMEQEGWIFGPPAAEQISQRLMQADENQSDVQKTDPDSAGQKMDAEQAHLTEHEDL